MGRNTKDARANMRQLSAKEEAMFQMMVDDVKRLEGDLRASIEERSEVMEYTLMDLAASRDAINAGLNAARKELEKLNRRLGKSKADERAAQAIRDVAMKLGSVRNTYLEIRKRTSDALNKPPTSIDMVEDFVQSIIRTAATWEDEARRIEGGFSGSVDFSMPEEFAALEAHVKGGGYEVLLAGEDRDPQSLKAFNEELEALMYPEQNSDD